MDNPIFGYVLLVFIIVLLGRLLVMQIGEAAADERFDVGGFEVVGLKRL